MTTKFVECIFQSEESMIMQTVLPSWQIRDWDPKHESWGILEKYPAFFWHNARISFLFHNFQLCLLQLCEKIKSRYCHRMDRSSGEHPTSLYVPVVFLSVSVFPELGFSWWHMSYRSSWRKKSGIQTWVEWGPVTQAFHTGKERKCGERHWQQAI